jgi:FkbM family methyltransferase|tara:strand:+ start:494 stop:1351 length:858 start_codon:yes stop_codon:yes gene_type:complete
MPLTNIRMNLFKINFIKLIFFLGQNTIFGRGLCRKFLISILNNFILNSKDKKNLNPRFDLLINAVPFNFYSDNRTGKKIYFGRNECKEIDFIKSKLDCDFVFIDIGANMGLYTNSIAYKFGQFPDAKIICIEPDPISHKRLKQNLNLLLKKNPNIFKQVKLEKCAVGNKNSDLKLYLGHDHAVTSFSNSHKKQRYLTIHQKKLLGIIKKYKLSKITMLKIDIEGYEDRALTTYFKNAKKSLFPKYIVIEHSNKKMWKENVLSYLLKIGYSKIWNNNNNAILSLNK